MSNVFSEFAVKAPQIWQRLSSSFEKNLYIHPQLRKVIFGLHTKKIKNKKKETKTSSENTWYHIT